MQLGTRLMKRVNNALLLMFACSFTLCIDYKAPYQNISEGSQVIAMVTHNPTDAASQSPGAPSYSKAPSFQLEDQHGQTHSYQFPRERVSLLAFGDWQGSEQIEGWISPLYRRYEKRIEILGVADVSAVPTPLRGLVRRGFRSKLDYPVMLDWSGEVSKSYGYRRGEANIFLVDRRGHIVLIKIGKANAPDLDRIYQTVDKLLQEG